MKARAPPPRLRPGLVGSVLLAVALAAMLIGGFVIDRAGEAILSARQKDVAESARDYFVAFAHEEGLAPLARALDRRERAEHDEAFRYALFSDDGDLVGGAQLATAAQLPGPGFWTLDLRSGEHVSSWQVLVQPISTGGTLVVFEDLSARAEFRSAIVGASFAALAVALGSVVLAGLWLNRLVYRRAESIAAVSACIVSGDLSARASADPQGDVFDRLGMGMNAMLDRNEELLTGLRTVSDSLAHDLRSPLTRMKGALSRALAADASVSDRLDAIAQAWEEADRALATTSALLDIARAETGVSRDMFERIDLQALVADTVELFAPVIEDAGQDLKVTLPGQPLFLQAHELLVRQALGNLLFNASRYAGEGADVVVSLSEGPGFVEVVVADSGPGIPEVDRGRVQERFVRLDTARTTTGSGLGLAIAAACAKLHRGSLDLQDNGPGLRVVMRIPRGGTDPTPQN
ncbi:MAG: HAMP domain-containing histidine kinase [Phenylobacterium sp.]|uniref:sensor histidine kinase n=1 Tax=Phenylobacterium sp. TaxID=1871053 RepID=UPI00120BAE69|nr:HAMP domain-containing sensor histidine kinase [Phenylobacterium sp.]TAJ68711.1 MAG: HAMP domain-containing histidine kinase [Phenylobacterium sp.]